MAVAFSDRSSILLTSTIQPERFVPAFILEKNEWDSVPHPARNLRFLDFPTGGYQANKSDISRKI